MVGASRLFCALRCCQKKGRDQATRAISTARLKRLHALHLPPITWSSPTALQGPYGPGVFILGRVSHLDAFSGYPYRTSLTGRATGVTAGTRAVRPPGSSRTKVGLPQHSHAHHGYRPNCLTTF